MFMGLNPLAEHSVIFGFFVTSSNANAVMLIYSIIPLSNKFT